MLTPLGIHSLNVLSTLGRSLRRFRTTGGDLFAASAIGDTIRRNEIGIQMIDESMRSILFPASLPSSKSSWSPDAPEISCLIKTHLQRHDLWEKPTTVSQSVDLQLEPLLGNSIFDHFTAICERNYCDYFNLANLLLSSPPPQLPTTWRLCQGWTRYVHGSDPVSVQHPLEDVYVFDVETLMSQSRCAVMAIAMSPTARAFSVNLILFILRLSIAGSPPTSLRKSCRMTKRSSSNLRMDSVKTIRIPSIQTRPLTVLSFSQNLL